MKTFRVIATICALVAAGISCVKPEEQGKEPEPEITDIELATKSAEYVEKGNCFAYDFIDRVNRLEEGDYIVSPLSLQFVLGMVLNGAQGQTAEEIYKLLGYGAGEIELVNKFFLNLLTQLPVLDKNTQVALANALVVNQKYSLLDSYQDTVRRYYQAGISNLDFNDMEGSAQIINQWASDHTNGMIKKILERVDPDMFSYLINATYFKGTWALPFKAANTAEASFTDESGNNLTVKMMQQKDLFNYAETDVYQKIILPYGNGAYTMAVLLPKAGYTVSDITDALKKGQQTRGSKAEVDLWLPKFETTYSIRLNDMLSSMGMPTAFDQMKADFKGMSQSAWCLSMVKQDAAIKVDEQGAEASAVTTIGLDGTTGYSVNKVFHADHPFLYMISETSTGAILFAGRYGGH